MLCANRYCPLSTKPSDPELLPVPQQALLLTSSSVHRNKDTNRDEFIFYSKRLMRLLIEHALSFLPLKVSAPHAPCQRPPCTSRLCSAARLSVPRGDLFSCVPPVGVGGDPPGERVRGEEAQWEKGRFPLPLPSVHGLLCPIRLTGPIPVSPVQCFMFGP